MSHIAKAMELNSRIYRYRTYIQHDAELAAQCQSAPICEGSRLESSDSPSVWTDFRNVKFCFDHIFRTMEWCGDLMDMNNAVVTFWSNQFGDLVDRVEDIRGVYKNRPAEELITIGVLCVHSKTRSFMPLSVRYVAQFLNLEFSIQDLVYGGSQWLIHLPQLNVMLMMIDCVTPCSTFMVDGDYHLWIHPVATSKIMSLEREYPDNRSVAPSWNRYSVVYCHYESRCVLRSMPAFTVPNEGIAIKARTLNPVPIQL